MACICNGVGSLSFNSTKHTSPSVFQACGRSADYIPFLHRSGLNVGQSRHSFIGRLSAMFARREYPYRTSVLQ